MSSGGLSRAQTATVAAAKVAVLAAFGLVSAYWTWAAVAPAPLPPAAETPEPSGRLDAAGGIFGQRPGGATSTPPTGLAIKLLGVIAGQPQGVGYALLQLDAKDTHLVRAGGEVAPGVRIESVLPDQVILQRHGAREALAWPEQAQAQAQAETPASTRSSPAR